MNSLEQAKEFLKTAGESLSNSQDHVALVCLKWTVTYLLDEIEKKTLSTRQQTNKVVCPVCKEPVYAHHNAGYDPERFTIECKNMNCCFGNMCIEANSIDGAFFIFSEITKSSDLIGVYK